MSCERNPWTCRCPEHYDPEIVEMQRRHDQKVSDAIDDLDDELVDSMLEQD
jgi:hypothetical protein